MQLAIDRFIHVIHPSSRGKASGESRNLKYKNYNLILCFVFFFVVHFDELKNFESGLLAVGTLYFTIPVCLALSVLRYTTYLFRQSILEMSSQSVINFCLCEV